MSMDIYVNTLESVRRPEHNAKGGDMELNFEVLEMQKLNILTDSAQNVDEKNGVICLDSADGSKKSVWQNI